MTSTFQIENDLAYLKPSRQPSRWRQRLARFLRGQRRSKSGRTAPISQAPPRLGPIGQDIKFDTDNSLVRDFSSLRFNDGGSLGDFRLSFDAPESDFGGFGRRNVSGGSEREKDSKKVNVKRQSRSAAGESTIIHGTPSVDLPKFELDTGKGFLDTWLLNAVSTGTENNENKKPTPVGKAQEVAKPKTRTPIASQFSTAAPPIASQFSTVPLSTRSPLSEQTTNSKVRDQDTDLEAKRKSMQINGLNGHPVTSADMLSGQTKRKAEDLSSSAPTKRGSTVRNSVITSSATAISPRLEEKLDSFPRPPSSVRQSVDYGRKESVPSQRLSIYDSRDEAPSRSMSVHSKRLSVGSDLGHETSYRTPAASKRTSIGSAAQVPGAVPSLVDSDTVSTSSSSTSNKKFEIKTVNLLQPVTRTAADKQAEAVSNKISRINSGTMSAPTSAPRQAGERRVVTEQIRSRSRQEVERSPSRRFSQPGIRSSYMEASRSASPAPASQNTTPDIGSHPDATARQRRPSSRLSDRMSWLRELEDANNKQTGRDFVFRKMEGGVASKLAAFENKASGLGSGAQTPSGTSTGLGLGLSRSNSITSRMSSSDLYGIENSRLSRRTTHENPGSISDVVDEGFKKKLEGMTGNMASKIQKQQEEQGGSNARGPSAMAAARRKIPQDVLDFIALSGVDPEIAINEYLQQGTLGKTKDWDHDEVLKQINTFVGEESPAGKAVPVEKETLPAKAEEAPRVASVEDNKPEIKDSLPKEAQKVEEQKPVVDTAVPSVSSSAPEVAPPPVEDAKDNQVEQSKEEPIEQPEEVIQPTTVDKKTSEPLPELASPKIAEAPKEADQPLEKEEVKPSAPAQPTEEKQEPTESFTPIQASKASSKATGTAFLVTETNDSEKPEFNAASLPGFSN